MKNKLITLALVLTASYVSAFGHNHPLVGTSNFDSNNPMMLVNGKVYPAKLLKEMAAEISARAETEFRLGKEALNSWEFEGGANQRAFSPVSVSVPTNSVETIKAFVKKPTISREVIEYNIAQSKARKAFDKAAIATFENEGGRVLSVKPGLMMPDYGSVQRFNHNLGKALLRADLSHQAEYLAAMAEKAQAAEHVVPLITPEQAAFKVSNKATISTFDNKGGRFFSAMPQKSSIASNVSRFAKLASYMTPKTAIVALGAIFTSAGCAYGYNKYFNQQQSQPTAFQRMKNTIFNNRVATGAVATAAVLGLYGAYRLWNWSKPTKFESKPEEPKKKKIGKHVTFHPSVK